ncbi:MAG: hypothetical protein MJZ15_03125 [Bacteroidales bacterium]|nr:hypothetical protein [Bacteroidales bacterium]
MDFKQFLASFKIKTGYDFCDYSDNSISRRLDKISAESKLSFEQMLDKVMTDETFKNKVIDEITVNTTELFRDPTMWISLYKTLYQQLPKSATITFWHIGCSRGLEVYSNLIMMHLLGNLDRCRAIGTDLNSRVLEIGRKGEYSYRFNLYFKDNFNAVMAGCGLDAKFEDYFDIDESQDKMKVKPFLLEKPKFIEQNLVQDKAPFAYKVDVVFFRNVMIYFNDKLQNKIMSMVCSKMYDGAALILGKQESLTSQMMTRFTKTGQYYQKKVLL